jgi:hypothetical protein
MADSTFNTYIPPILPLDKFTGKNLSENMGLGVAKMKIDKDGGNAKRAEMGLPQYHSSLNKFLTQRAEVSYLDGRETLESVKAAAAGAPTKTPDYSSRLTHSLEIIELEKKDSGLTDEEIEALIRKRKIRRETLEKWRLERRDASNSDKEVSIQSTGSIELATLSTMVIDDAEPVFNKQEKVAQTYSQPQVESDGGGDSNVSNSSAVPVLNSEA